jgi:hypothetical protein
MNAVGAIRKILLDEAMVTGLLADSTSIYPVILPQDKQYPAVTLMVVDTKPNDSKTQVSGIDNVQVVANIFAKTYDRAQQIDTMVRNTIDGFSGGVTTSDATVHYIDAVRFLGRKDDFDEENILFVRQCIYDVRYFRDIPPLPFGTPYISGSKAWMKLLPVYDSDESAVSDGLEFEDVYLTADNHMSGMGGVPKQVRIVT